ncbi:MAG: acyl-CoA dehydrogenase family protein [Candidatus Lloydbacteria bacterium]|nr:acyl-CoA dehydrogenase family protein [Candidatus Lloydbacteria bacterium]
MLPLDFYKIESLLTDEEQMIQQSAAKFVDREILPIIGGHFEKGIPLDISKKLGENGFLGTCVSTHGGTAISPVAYGLLMQELERGDSGIRSFASVQNSLVVHLIDLFGSDEQKDKYLPGLIGGEKIGCFGLTEADAGSDPSGMRTKAVKCDGGYVLNGSKMWITNAFAADYSIVWAYLDGVVRAFIIPKGTSGLSVRLIHHKFSMRASDTGEITLNDCKIPEENIIAKARGLRSALTCLNHARYGIVWGVLGAATACYQEALQHAKTRIMFGKPIGSFQLVQEKLADMLTGITSGQLIALQLGRLMEKGEASPAQISLAKRHNVRMALDVARSARDVLGASGISIEYHTIRHMLNLESVFTYEGTDSMHTLILGKEITGIDAFGKW